jgi:hypothetical protein
LSQIKQHALCSYTLIWNKNKSQRRCKKWSADWSTQFPAGLAHVVKCLTIAPTWKWGSYSKGDPNFYKQFDKTWKDRQRFALNDSQSTFYDLYEEPLVYDSSQTRVGPLMFSSMPRHYAAVPTLAHSLSLIVVGQGQRQKILKECGFHVPISTIRGRPRMHCNTKNEVNCREFVRFPVPLCGARGSPNIVEGLSERGRYEWTSQMAGVVCNFIDEIKTAPGH